MLLIPFEYIEHYSKNYDLKRLKIFWPQISLKFMDQSFCPHNSTEDYPKSTSTRNFEAIKSIFTPAMIRHSKLIFAFFNVYVFLNNKRTVIAKKIILFRKYRYLNSLSHATHPIQIRRAVFENLRFEKKRLKQF